MEQLPPRLFGSSALESLGITQLGSAQSLCRFQFTSLSLKLRLMSANAAAGLPQPELRRIEWNKKSQAAAFLANSPRSSTSFRKVWGCSWSAGNARKKCSHLSSRPHWSNWTWLMCCPRSLQWKAGDESAICSELLQQVEQFRPPSAKVAPPEANADFEGGVPLQGIQRCI